MDTKSKRVGADKINCVCSSSGIRLVSGPSPSIEYMSECIHRQSLFNVDHLDRIVVGFYKTGNIGSFLFVRISIIKSFKPTNSLFLISTAIFVVVKVQREADRRLLLDQPGAGGVCRLLAVFGVVVGFHSCRLRSSKIQNLKL